MLAVRDLRAGYGAVEVLRGVSLDVARGELITLVGPNGAGKSTLLRTLAGLIVPRGGRIELDGLPLQGLAPEEIVARGVALVPEGRELFGPLAVRTNLALGAWATPRAGRSRRIARLTATTAIRLLPSAVVEPPSPIAQPQPHEMALALGLRVIAKGGAPVPEPAIVDDLNLPAAEEELAVEARRLHDAVERLQGSVAFGIERN